MGSRFEGEWYPLATDAMMSLNCPLRVQCDSYKTEVLHFSMWITSRCIVVQDISNQTMIKSCILNMYWEYHKDRKKKSGSLS